MRVRPTIAHSWASDAVRIERRELAVERGRGTDRRGGHVGRGVVVVVEDHDVHEVDPGAVLDRVAEHGEAARVQAGRARREGVLHLDGATLRREPVLQDPQALVAPVDAVGSLEGAVLDVHVEPGRPEHRQDRGIAVRDRLRVGARVADLAPGVVGRIATERRDDVAAHPAQRGDVHDGLEARRCRRSRSRRSSRARTNPSRSSRGTRASCAGRPKPGTWTRRYRRTAPCTGRIRGPAAASRAAGQRCSGPTLGRGARTGRGLGDAVGGAVKRVDRPRRRSGGRRRDGQDGSGAGRQGAGWRSRGRRRRGRGAGSASGDATACHPRFAG